MTRLIKIILWLLLLFNISILAIFVVDRVFFVERIWEANLSGELSDLDLKIALISQFVVGVSIYILRTIKNMNK